MSDLEHLPSSNGLAWMCLSISVYLAAFPIK